MKSRKRIHSPLLALKVLFAVLMLGLTACQVDEDGLAQDQLSAMPEIPSDFPTLPVPADNYLTPSRVALGKRLFYDPLLSKDTTISCGNCHFQSNAFADTAQFSTGIDGGKGFRNAPALFNLAWHPYFFLDGGVPTLEQQVLAPLDNPLEMGITLSEVISRLRDDLQYPALFRAAYGREPDAFALTRAIAAYERTLVSGNSPYDRYRTGTQPDALNAAAQRGLALFENNALQCRACHAGFNFTDYEFYNIGLPITTADSGRMRITLNEADRGAYKTPSLRNVAVTGPYMHDGSLKTLEEVIDFLASGGQHFPNQAPQSQGFTITTQEKSDLIAFLNALTDETFLVNPSFRK